jgi:hypothetical protein
VSSCGAAAPRSATMAGSASPAGPTAPTGGSAGSSPDSSAASNADDAGSAHGCRRPPVAGPGPTVGAPPTGTGVPGAAPAASGACVMRTATTPNVTTSPARRRAVCTRTPLRKVPLREPRSRTTRWSCAPTSSAWRRDTVGSASASAQSAERPTTSAPPSASAARRLPAGSTRTKGMRVC